MPINPAKTGASAVTGVRGQQIMRDITLAGQAADFHMSDLPAVIAPFARYASDLALFYAVSNSLGESREWA